MDVNERLEYRNRKVGFMPQEDLFIETLTLHENIELPLIIQGVKGRERKARVREAMEKLNIWRLKDRKPHQVSGGERRKAALARSLINNPKILFVDEPTSNLDTSSALTVLESLKTLNSQGVTIIISTHDIFLFKNMGRMLLIRSGVLNVDFKI